MRQERLKQIGSFFARPFIQVLFVLFLLLAFSAGILWWLEISYVYPGPSISVGVLAVMVLIVGLIIQDLLKTRYAPHTPDIVGLEILVSHWQQFKKEINREDSERIYQQLRMAQRVFPDVSALTIKECFPGNKPEKTVALVTTPSGSNVLKFDKTENINKEQNRYDTCVKGRLGDHTPGRIVNYWPQDSNSDYGAIVYELAQMDQESTLRTFGQFYSDESISTTSKILVLNKIIDKIGQSWWKNIPTDNERCPYKSDSRVEQGSLYHEYDRLRRHLPAMKKGFEADLANEFASVLFVANGRLVLRDEKANSYNLCDPLSWIEEMFGEHKNQFFKEAFQDLDDLIPKNRSTVHGDFHTGNILVESENEGEMKIWFIDFPHAHIGPTVQDIARLEADIKFGLIPFEQLQGTGVSGLYNFEKALIPRADNPSAPVPDKSCPVENKDFQRAWDIVKRLRQETATHIGGDARFYYIALLHAALPTLYYGDRSPWQKLYTYISAALLCEQLGGLELITNGKRQTRNPDRDEF